MGLLDLFKKKDVFEKIKEYVETENTGRIIRYVSENNPPEVRMFAIDALKNIKMDELCVDTLMKLVKDDERLIVLAACNSLKRVGTKREVDHLLNYADETDDEEIKKALTETALMCKERTPRF
jgi:HEAT repeat protein